jgi:hypothetical protein
MIILIGNRKIHTTGVALMVTLLVAENALGTAHIKNIVVSSQNNFVKNIIA